MNFGEKLKQLRNDKNWTQPQAAEAIGIEQSYLSKLENDKSIPSAEIFQSILTAFRIDAGEMLEGLDIQLVQQQLKQIPEVANYLNNRALLRTHNIRKWLYASAVACILGLTLIVAGTTGLIFSAAVYEYRSRGVIPEGQPLDFFERHMAGDLSDDQIAFISYQRQQLEPDVKLLKNYRGDSFIVRVDGGSRIYGFRPIANLPAYKAVGNRYLILLGLLLSFSGLFGFIVEWRLRKIQ